MEASNMPTEELERKIADLKQKDRTVKSFDQKAA